MKMIGDCTIPVMLLSLGVRMLDVKREDFSRSLLGAAVCPLTGLLMAGIIVQYLPMSKSRSGSSIFRRAATPPCSTSWSPTTTSRNRKRWPDRARGQHREHRVHSAGVVVCLK